MPCFNVINGGEHAGNALAFQEFMIVPIGATSFREAVQMGSEVFQTLKKMISKLYGSGATAVGDEGGFAPDGITSNSEVINVIRGAIEQCGYTGRFAFALDVAASEFYDKSTGLYDLNYKNPKSNDKLTGSQLVETYVNLINPSVKGIHMSRLYLLLAEFAREDERFDQLDVDGHHNVMVIDPPTMLRAILDVA